MVTSRPPRHRPLTFEEFVAALEEERRRRLLAQPQPTREPPPFLRQEPLGPTPMRPEDIPPPGPGFADFIRTLASGAAVAGRLLRPPGSVQQTKERLAFLQGVGYPIVEPAVLATKEWAPWVPPEEKERAFARRTALAGEMAREPLSALFMAAPPGAMAVGGIGRGIQEARAAAQAGRRGVAAGLAGPLRRPGAALRVLEKPQVAGAALPEFRTLKGIDNELRRLRTAIRSGERVKADTKAFQEDLDALTEYREGVLEGILGDQRYTKLQTDRQALYEAQETLAAMRETKLPRAPHFGTTERAEFEARRMKMGEEGIPVGPKARRDQMRKLQGDITSLKAQVRAAEGISEEIEPAAARRIGAVQAGMDIGERPAQGELLPEFRGAGIEGPGLVDIEAMQARAARRAQIAAGQAEMPVTEPVRPTAQRGVQPPIGEPTEAVAPRRRTVDELLKLGGYSRPFQTTAAIERTERQVAKTMRSLSRELETGDEVILATWSLDDIEERLGVALPRLASDLDIVDAPRASRFLLNEADKVERSISSRIQAAERADMAQQEVAINKALAEYGTEEAVAPPAAPVAPPPAVAEPPLRPPPPALVEAAAPPAVPPTRPPVSPRGPMGPEESDALLRQFATYIHSPESISLANLTKQLRQQQLGQRIAVLQSRTEALLAQGQKFEDALRQAQIEAMSGAFERPGRILPEAMAEQFRDAAFSRLYTVLANEPIEQMATAEALRNALAGKAIPRTLGTAGGSAYTRLSRIFPPEVVAVLEKGKPVAQIMEDALLSPAARYQFARPLGEWDASMWREAGEQLGLDIAQVPSMTRLQQQALTNAQRFELESFGMPRPEGSMPLGEWPTGLWRETGEQVGLGLPGGKAVGIPIETKPLTFWEQQELRRGYPAGSMPSPTGVTPPVYEPPIQTALEVPHLMPPEAQHLIIRSLKEAGWTAVDIGNFLRANKASFDFSFWRQQAPLILNHKRDFVQANVTAWRALWKKGAAEASWRRIQNDPLFQLYEELGLDFLRPLELRPGMSRFRGVEEFGFLQSDRPIPKFTGKLPWVKVSQRAFVTGTNEHNWRIFKSFYQDMLKVNERIASGRVTLKEGEAFSIRNNMRGVGKLLEDFSGRASLGRARELAPAMSGFLFAPRYALGRLLSPRHLFSANPYVRKEAWKDAVMFVGGFGSLLMLGKELRLWDVELDPRSSDFAKMRIGNTRIDPWGGYQQFVRFFAQIVTNSGVSTATGQTYKADPLQSLTRFLRGKASPLAAMVADFKTGKTYVGDDINLRSPKQWIDRIAPLLPMDIYEAIVLGDMARGAIIALPATVGAGVSTYGKVPLSWQKDLQPYFDIPANSREATAKGQDTREQYRKNNPEVDAKLFLAGQVQSLVSFGAKQVALRLMQENNIKLEDIQGLEVEEYESEARKKLRDWFQQSTRFLMGEELEKERARYEAPVRSEPTPVGAR